MIKITERWNKNVKGMLEKLLSCQVERQRVPKPKVSRPKSAHHNHVVKPKSKYKVSSLKSQGFGLNQLSINKIFWTLADNKMGHHHHPPTP